MALSSSCNESFKKFPTINVNLTIKNPGGAIEPRVTESQTFNPTQERPLTPTWRSRSHGFELPKLVDLNPRIINEKSQRMFTQKSGKNPANLVEEYSQIKSVIEAFHAMMRGQHGFDGDSDDEGPCSPLPYQARYFKSSTVLKMVSVPQRHPDMFSSRRGFPKKKGIILHTDRYYWDEKQILENRQTQRERLQSEMAQLEKLRTSKRKNAAETPHRLNHDLLLGGTKVEFEERVDINGELERLRSIVLPPGARELFVGKGFTLPQNHQILKPRKKIKPPSPGETVGRKLSDAGSDHPSTTYMRECSCTRLPALPRLNSFARRGKKRKSIDETSLPSISRRNSNIVQNKSTLPSTERKPELILSNRDRYVNCEEAVPDWAKDEDEDNPEVEIAINFPAADENNEGKPPRSPMKAVTPNPLKAAHLKIKTTDEERQKLTETFRRLDTDADGHLLYQQLKTQFPEILRQQHERYLKVVYDITSTSTYFGVDEFITLSHLMRKLTQLSQDVNVAYESIDMLEIKDDIIQFVELYESIDREGKGDMSMESMEELLCSSFGTSPEKSEDTFKKIFGVINPENTDSVSKMDFLAYIPFFIHMKRSIPRNKLYV